MAPKIDTDSLEKDEAEIFNNEVLLEFGIKCIEDLKDEYLILPHKRISMHLNFKEPPSQPYRYALYKLQNLQGKRVLDYCAGTGETTVIIVLKGPEIVEAFDISPLAVAVAKRRMRINKVNSRVNIQVMSAYSMRYPDNHFDIVYGNAVLHHLNLKMAMREILRVLKPGGKAIFCEPFAGSRILQLIRKLIPIKGSLSPHERQLTLQDISMISQIFSVSHINFMGLLLRLDRIIKIPFVLDFIADFDGILIRLFPPLQKYARSVVIVFNKRED